MEFRTKREAEEAADIIRDMEQAADLYDSGPEEEISGVRVREWIARIRVLLPTLPD